MRELYKGKYLIAVYDKNDCLVDVAYKPSELKCFENTKSAKEVISHIANGCTDYKGITLIDVTEIHDDVFAEEDRLFIEFLLETRPKTISELALELGISRRKYYRMNK